MTGKGKPTPAQRKVLEAMRDGAALEHRQPLRLNKPRHWTLAGRKISGKSPDVCRAAGWIDATHEPFRVRWGDLYTLTPAGLAALTAAQPPEKE